MQSSKNMRLRKFKPRGFDEDANAGLGHSQDFMFNPTKFYCKEHRSSEVEFYCEVANIFYCKRCQPDHAKHYSDKVITSIPFQLQKQIIQLKILYQKKKETLVDKLDSHQLSVEKIFKVFYDELDRLRNEMLNQEYTLKRKMDEFESETKSIVN